VRGIPKFRSQLTGFGIKIPGPAVGGPAGDRKLATADIPHFFRRGFSPQTLEKPLQIQLPSLGIFCPVDKGRAPAGIVGFP
jgi:hypothetical protein